MRFVCDSCRAQYMISDEKVGAKGVKVRCKKCGHVILVRRGDAPASADAGGHEHPEAESAESGSGAAPESKSQPSASAIFGGVDDDELGAAFDQALSPGSAPPKAPSDDLIASQLGGAEGPNDVESTRVMDAVAIQRLAAESEVAQGADSGEKKPSPEDHEWFVAIDEKQTGPLTVAKIKEHWDRGEITADSLTWRAGLPDWVPMSEVTELAAILAPRPTKPIIIAPAPLSPSAPSAPVESAFSGSAARSTRTEIKPMAAAGPEEAGGWRPTAARALVSLMKDEMAAIQRPTSTSMRPMLQAPVAAPAPGLLDVPASADSGMNGHGHLEHENPAPARTGQQRAMAAPPPASSYAAPPQAYGAYRPSASSDRTNRTVMIIGGAIVLTLLLLGSAVVYLLSRNTGPAPVAMAQAPAPAAPPPVAVVAPPPVAAPAPAAAAPVKAGLPAGAVAENTPPPVRNVIPARAPDIIAPNSESHHRGTRAARGARVQGTVEDPAVSSAPMPPEPSSDDFDKAFGSAETKKGPVAAAPPKRRETYVPPAPGSGSSLEELGVGDIMQVVNNNKPAVVHCVEEQKKKEPGLTGKLVMHFNINTNGRTSGVSVSPQSSEFKSSYMANCITGLIKSWRFPAHKLQHDPVDFPFVF